MTQTCHLLSLVNFLKGDNSSAFNFSDLTPERILDAIESVGIYKPSSKVYDMPIKKYSFKKKEIAFLSANTWDVSAGGNYGYNSIWVNRNNSIFDNLDYLPKKDVKNLSQLLAII